MGIFADIVDVGTGFVTAGKTKTAIGEAVSTEVGQADANLEANADLQQRILDANQVFTDTGNQSAQSVFDLVSGNRRLEPTAGETFALERGQENVDRLAAANKSLFSGNRIEESIGRAQDISSRFRQDEINNLNTIANRGFNATAANQRFDANITGEENSLRTLIGNIKSGGILGKNQQTVGALANLGGTIGNLSDSAVSAFTGGFGGGGPQPTALNQQLFANSGSPVFSASR